jgi:tetratricopeptide (TPR) repeat protein
MQDRRLPRNEIGSKQIRILAVLNAMSRLLPLLLLTALPALALDPALRDQIDALAKQRQWPQAQALLEKATAATPKDGEAWQRLSQVFIQLGDADRAVETMEQAAALAPASSDLQRQLGDAYGFAAQKAGMLSKMGLAKKCKAAYDKAVALDPGNIDARWSVMEYCRQAPGFVGGGMDGAYAQAEEIRKLDPNRGRIALATLYVSEKKMVEAFGLFDEALKEDPASYIALYQLGRLSAMTGQRLDQGIANLRKCLTLAPPPGQPGAAPVNWRIGNILEKKGDKAAAKAAYEAAVAADANFVPAIESLRKLNAGG